MQLNVRDVARLLDVSEKTIYRWIKEGNIPAYHINDQYRFNRAELLEWATSQKINVSPDIFKEPESSSVLLPSFAEALSTGGIFYRVGGHDKESVLRSIVQLLRLPEEVDRDFLFKVLLAREALGSTGIGDGIAIPHVRNPIVLHVQRPSITLSFLEKPIDFDSLDGQPVRTLFTLISPTVKAHLHLLSRLSFALRNPNFKKAVLYQESQDTILNLAKETEPSIPSSPNPNQKKEGI